MTTNPSPGIVERLLVEWPISTRSPFLGSQPVNPDGPEAAALLKEMAEALEALVYETTHLSPPEDDGAHLCRISSEALAKGRKALSTYHGDRT